MKLLSAAAVAAALVLAAVPAAAPAAFPGRPGRIAFDVNFPGPDIETVDPDGSDPQLLTRNPSTCPCDIEPAWSPDGRQIAFARLDKSGGPFRIWVMNADGTNAHPISPGPEDQDPGWSPDGTQLLYVSGAGSGEDQLAVIGVDGTGFHTVGPRGVVARGEWSPDGGSIASSYRGPHGAADLFVMRPDGTGLRDLTNDPQPSGCMSESIFPDWSPDSSRLAYSGNDTFCGNPLVMTIGADGSGRTVLGREQPPGIDHAGQLYPAWSPDGTRIAFAQNPQFSSDFQIYVMNADGGDPHQITSGGFNHGYPSWQPAPTARSTSTTVSCAPNPSAAGGPTTCSATVSDVDAGTKSTPTGTVGFTGGGPGAFDRSSCTLAASAPGVASCSVRYTPTATPDTPVRSDQLTAVYGGDGAHAGSRGSTTVTVLSIGRLASGSFVIGDRGATVGARVTFWGPRWAAQNALSGGIAPPSFKGFASTTQAGLPRCGARWSSTPGDSSSPPGAVPRYMAAIVASVVTKSGATISGDARSVVVVKTDPGYDGRGAHPGTGVVVAQICP